MRWPRTREIWIGSILLAALLVWAGRYFVNPDGISYLDLSDDVRAGRFGAAVNAHWSPGYPYLLAIWLSPLSPGSQWESTAVHVLSGLLFIGTLAAFEFFLRELAKSQPDSNRLALPLKTPAGRFAAYMVFLWCALVLITIRAVTPDMLAAVFGFIGAGLLTRIQNNRASVKAYIAFGATLAAAALTKSFMFPVAALFLGASAFSAVNKKRSWLLAAATFAILTAPQVTALSVKQGKLTIGESGRIVYLMKVNKIPKLRDDISYFPTDQPNRTYPVWDDPAKTFEGTKVDFNVRDQAEAIRKNLVTFGGIALKVLIPLLIVLGLKDRKIRLRNRALMGISIFVIAAYLLLHIEARLTGFWLAILILSTLAGITLSDDSTRQKTGRGFVHLIAVVSVISFVTYAIDQSTRLRRNTNWNVAQALERFGGGRGSRIALVGDESDIYWTRLAGVQVAAQISLRTAESYAMLPNDAIAQIHQQFASVGANTVVTSWTHPPARFGRWIHVEDNFWILPPTE